MTKTPDIEALLEALDRVRELRRREIEGMHYDVMNAIDSLREEAWHDDTGHLAALEAIAALQEQVRQLREALKTKPDGMFTDDEQSNEYCRRCGRPWGMQAALVVAPGEEEA